MPTGNAWKKGDLCRHLDFLCSGVEGDIKSAAELSVFGLIFASIGLTCVIAHAMRQNYQGVLFISLAFWVIAWILLLASWAVFAGSLGKNAVCKVEAESKKGAVIATGKFGDIINLSGSYTFAVVIGAWLLSFAPITLILFRINELRGVKQEAGSQLTQLRGVEQKGGSELTQDSKLQQKGASEPTQDSKPQEIEPTLDCI
jgi:hypothetical protein